jgi:hypothetical protein
MTDLFDPAAAPNTEPSVIVAGDLVQWRREDFSVYALGAAHTLLYVFRPAGGGANVDVTTTIEGQEFRATMSSTVTAAMVSGRWYWSAFLIRTSDSARVQVDDGELMVEANLQVDASDTRTHARRTLDAIEAAIEGRATDTVQSYTIGGRQINKMDAKELITWRNYYINEVRTEEDAERRRNGLSSRNTILARFT